MKAYTKEAQSAHYFAPAQEHFEGLVDQLCSESVKHFEHGEVEALIEQEGTEVLRRLLQGYLDLRAAQEPRCESLSATDGLPRRHCRQRERELMTLFGAVKVRRKGYSAHGLSSVFPLDEALNLTADKYSHGLRRRVGEEVVKGAFEEAALAIERGSGGKVPKRQVEQLTYRLSRDFDAYYQRMDDASEEHSEDLLVMSVDGKGIVMREQDLRQATRKAAQREHHKLKSRLSRGEKRNRKRMATVATIYSLTAQPREAEQILAQSGQEEETKVKHPKPYHKRVWASVQKEPLEVIDELFEAALRRDPYKKRRCWLMLVDGDERQLRAIERCIERYQVDVVIIQDFIHVLEYLWKAAYCFHVEGSEEAERWVMQRARMLLEGKATDTAAGMRRSATRRGLSKSERRPVEKCADYLLKNKERLEYGRALGEGWPIATGVIEVACRYLVKDRMQLSGARWSLEGAEAMLRVRSLHASGDLEAYMGFHIAQERQRNYPTPTTTGAGGPYASALAA